jgi:hypothetical protein
MPKLIRTASLWRRDPIGWPAILTAILPTIACAIVPPCFADGAAAATANKSHRMMPQV